MKTLMADSHAMIPAVRRMGHRQWYMQTAVATGRTVVDKVAPKKESVDAYISEGRWVADCPGCPAGSGAENVTLDDPVFMCLSCGNVLIGGKLRPVRFPEDGERLEIEEQLAKRKIANRHWFPDESVEKLHLENLSIGIGD